MSDYVRINDKTDQIYNPELDFTFSDIGENDDYDTPVAIFTIEFMED